MMEIERRVVDRISNICVVGVGGVGGYFGGKIAQSLARKDRRGQRIYFVARGDHLKEIQKSGLILNTSEKAGLVCMPDVATDRISEIPAPDLCLLCVKSYDLPETTAELAKIIKKETIILPLLNGVDIYERVKAVLTRGFVLPACVYVGTHIERHGVVTQRGGDGVVLCGKDPQLPDFNPEELLKFFGEAGIKLTWNDDPYPPIWEKYIFIAAFGLVTAHSGKTLGEVAADQRLRRLTAEIMEEIKLIADAKGIRLPDGIIEISLGKSANFPFETKTSFQRDIERSSRHEGDLFGETILKMGKKSGVLTPATEYVYSEIVRFFTLQA
jgi:2-dehydropantoate 2-reductase